MALVALIGFIGAGTAVVGGPNASDGEMTITSGSAGATTAVGPNGTQWTSSIENLNSSCRSPGDTENVDFIGFQADGELTELNFRGSINTSNPCSRISLDVEEVNDREYVIEVFENQSTEPCTQCTGTASFSASFAAEEDYRVEVIHDGDTLGVQETPGYGDSDTEEPEDDSDGSGVWGGLSGVLNWFSSLF